MRPPPPVLIDSAPGRWWLAVQMLLPALGAAALMAWIAASLEQPALSIGAWSAIAAAAAGIVAMRHLDRRRWQIAWTGSAWQLRPSPTDATAGDWLECAPPEIKIDLDRWLLLRVTAEGRVLWIAASAPAAGPQWKPWCAALYWSAEHRSPAPQATDV